MIVTFRAKMFAVTKKSDFVQRCLYLMYVCVFTFLCSRVHLYKLTNKNKKINQTEKFVVDHLCR